MAKDKSEALQGLAKSLEDLSGIGELAEEIKDLKDVIVDSNEELIATFVEGTKRIIKKEDKDVSPQLRNLSESITGGLEAVKRGVAEVERGVKSIKLPSGTDFRATGAMLKLPIKELTRAVEGLDLNISTDAKKPIAVRLSDGENFYKALDQVIQTISGGGGSSYAFDTQGGSPTKAATVQVSVGGKTRDAIVVVNPDGTEVGGSAAGGGLTDAELRATPVPVSGTVTANLSATDNTVLDNIDADLTTIIGHVDGIEGLLTTIDTDTGNIATSVASIDTKTPALGQALAAASVPVVLTAAQLTTLTPLSTVAVTQSGTWDEVGINDSGNSITVDNTGTFAVQVDGAALTSLQLIDDTVYTDGSGTVTKGVAILGQDGTNPQAIKTDTSGELQVDVLTMPTVTVTATNLDVQSGGADLATTTQAASIQTAVELIDDTVATLGTTTYTEAATKGLIIGAVRRDADTTLANTTNEVTPLQVDANGYLKVEIFDGGGSHTVDNNGTFVTQIDGAALTALQLIDNSVYVDDADWTADTSSHNLVGSVTQVAPTANTDGDTTPLISDALRQLRVAALESDLATAGTAHVKKYYTNAGAVTDGIIWSPAAGKRWFLTHLSINVSAAATVTIEDDLGAGDSAVYKAEFAANSGVVLTFPEVPMFSGEDAADLLVTTSAGNVYITAVGYEI